MRFWGFASLQVPSSVTWLWSRVVLMLPKQSPLRYLRRRMRLAFCLAGCGAWALYGLYCALSCTLTHVHLYSLSIQEALCYSEFCISQLLNRMYPVWWVSCFRWPRSALPRRPKLALTHHNCSWHNWQVETLIQVAHRQSLVFQILLSFSIDFCTLTAATKEPQLQGSIYRSSGGEDD